MAPDKTQESFQEEGKKSETEHDMRPEERREGMQGRGGEEGDFKEATLLVLKMEKEVICFKMPAASGCRKRQASSGFQPQSLQRNRYPD